MSLRAIKGQNPKLSVDTNAELEATDAGYLVDGDFAFVEATGLWFLASASSSTPSSTVLITANSAGGTLPGRWFFTGIGPSGPTPGGGGWIAVPDFAALQALDDTGFVDGRPVYVISLRSIFFRRVQALVGTDGITYTDTLTGTAVWWRDETPNRSWDFVLTWFIDGAAGNDNNDGQTDITPIATLDELARRLTSPLPPASVNVNVGPGGTTGKLVSASTIIMVGAETAGASAPITAYRPNNAATNQRELTTAVLAWDGNLFYRTDDGFYGYVVSHATPGVSAETVFSDAPTEHNPTVGQILTETDVPTMTGSIFMLNGANFFSQSMRFSGDLSLFSGQTSNFVFDRCIFNANNTGFSGADIETTTCIFNTPVSGTSTATIDAAVTKFSESIDRFRSVDLSAVVALVDRGSAIVRDGYALIAHDVTIRDLTSNGAFSIFGGGVARTDADGATKFIWGNNNGAANIIRLEENGANFYYRTVAGFVVTSTTNWFSDGGAGADFTGNWADLPYTDVDDDKRIIDTAAYTDKNVVYTELANVATVAAPGFVQLLTVDTIPSRGNALKIEASAAFDAGSDANMNCRILVDGAAVRNGGFGAESYAGPSNNSVTGSITKIVYLDLSVAHTIRLEWESPSSTVIEINPAIPPGGATSHQNQHATLVVTPIWAKPQPSP